MGAVASKKCEVFAENAVVHMAKWTCLCNSITQNHSLSQAVIGLLILEYCEENGFLSGSDVETLRGINNELISLSSSKKSFLSKGRPLLSAVSSAVKTLEERGRKAKLRLQYFKEVSVMHYFVRGKNRCLKSSSLLHPTHFCSPPCSWEYSIR
ncbi:hypothetical protein AVEN_140103-1 [Araneus ventricosus]|uniref:Uncharacterized protein n=1 Tax=Araneus ventricosus TaxID=182803 RepID=A0A4Y2UP53_ARAVE|nr:hypothetical protein AVEN_140103-1 [Araneus ventricosus]